MEGAVWKISHIVSNTEFFLIGMTKDDYNDGNYYIVTYDLKRKVYKQHIVEDAFKNDYSLSIKAVSDKFCVINYDADYELNELNVFNNEISSIYDNEDENKNN